MRFVTSSVILALAALSLRVCALPRPLPGTATYSVVDVSGTSGNPSNSNTGGPPGATTIYQTIVETSQTTDKVEKTIAIPVTITGAAPAQSSAPSPSTPSTIAVTSTQAAHTTSVSKTSTSVLVSSQSMIGTSSIEASSSQSSTYPTAPSSSSLESSTVTAPQVTTPMATSFTTISASANSTTQSTVEPQTTSTKESSSIVAESQASATQPDATTSLYPIATIGANQTINPALSTLSTILSVGGTTTSEIETSYVTNTNVAGTIVTPAPPRITGVSLFPPPSSLPSSFPSLLANATGATSRPAKSSITASGGRPSYSGAVATPSWSFTLKPEYSSPLASSTPKRPLSSGVLSAGCYNSTSMGK